MVVTDETQLEAALRAIVRNAVEFNRDGGSIVVRTQCYPSVAEVPSWWYARDATHINFFARRTLELAAALWGLRCQPTREPDIVVWSSDK